MTNVATLHRRGDAVPRDWYEVTPNGPGIPKIGELRFANPAVSQVLDDGSRSLRGHFTPLIDATSFDSVTIRFTRFLHIEQIAREG